MSGAALATFLSCNKAGALKQYEQYLKSNPNDYEARFKKAYCHLVVQDRPGAANEYREIARRAQSDCVRDVANAMIAHAEGRTEECKNALKNMVDPSNHNGRYKTSSLAWHYLGEMRRMTGDLGGAVEAYETAANFSPSDAWNRTLCGDALRQRGDFNRAKVHFQEALRNGNQVTMAYAGLALCYMAEGNVSQARTHLTTANTINPNLVSTTDPYEYRAKINENECWSQIDNSEEVGSEMNAAGRLVTSRRIGASGKPFLHFTRFENRSKAMEAAREAGRGNPPVHHTSHESGQRPHFHPADRNGEIIKSGAHFEY